jgi:thiamine biosynthesis protein ThiC
MSKLETVSAPFLKQEIAKNRFTSNKQYNVSNKDALSPIGKGENNGNIGSAIDISDRATEIAKNKYNNNYQYNDSTA